MPGLALKKNERKLITAKEKILIIKKFINFKKQQIIKRF